MPASMLTRRIGRPACDVSRARLESSGPLVVPAPGIAEGPAWRHLSDLRAGALQTLVATVIPNQNDEWFARGLSHARRRDARLYWWRRDPADVLDATSAAAPLLQVIDALAVPSLSTTDNSNFARRHAGAPAAMARLETVASAGRRAGGREPACT